MRPTPLLVTGFHRSGTSFVTSLLHAGGLDVGTELLKANWSNAHGHFEDRDVVEFHDDMLDDTFGHWCRPSGVNALYTREQTEWITRYILRRSATGRPFGFKDPRLCLTIRAWSMALPRLSVLFVHRDPRAAIASLWRRAWGDLQRKKTSELNAFLVHNPDFIAKMYLDYTGSFLSFARNCDPQRVNIHVVDHADVVDGSVDIFDVAKQCFKIMLKPVDVRDVFDASAITAENRVIDVDPALAEAIHRIDMTLRDCAAACRNADGGATGLGSVLAHRDRLPSGRQRAVNEDAAAYALACAEQRMRRAERRLQRNEAVLADLVQSLEDMQHRME